MDAELKEIFDLATASGVNLWDTGDSYGTGRLDGQAEKLLGRFSGGSPECLVATKLAGYPWRVTPGAYVDACRASLARVGQERLAVAQLHWSTANYQPLQERAQWEGLARIAEEGLASAVGVSNYGPRQLEKIARFAERRGFALGSAQVQLSLVSYGPEQRDVADACRALGVTLVAYSPLGLGMLSGAYDPASGNVPRGPRGTLMRQVLPRVAPVTAALGAVARERGKTPSQVPSPPPGPTLPDPSRTAPTPLDPAPGLPHPRARFRRRQTAPPRPRPIPPRRWP